MTTKREVRVTAEKCYDMGYEVYNRQVDQQTAGYNPLSGTSEQACANCIFFMSPNGCTVVESYPAAISPTGLSKYWTAIPSPEDYSPLRVVIVSDPETDAEGAGMGEMSKQGRDKEKGLIDRIVAAVKSAFSPTATPLPADTGGDRPQTSEWVASLAPFDVGSLRLYKEADGGEWRWVALVSNKFRDRDNKENGPEIIEEAAHKEYVAYLDRTSDYPEAWLWHTPGTRWGKADWAEYTDGFLLMSGVVDKGMEDVAAALSTEALGVSHGFYQRYSDAAKGIIGWYRTFEVSALPPEAAANPWTALSVIQKEVGMPISAAKRSFIEGKLGKERTAALEGDVEALAKALTEAGVEYKDLLSAVASVEEASATLNAKDIADAITKAMEPTAAAMAALTETVTATKDATAATLAGFDTRLKAIEASQTASDDDKLAALLTAKSAEARRTKGYQASKEGGVLPEEDDLKDAKPGVPAGQKAWLETALSGF